MHTIMVLITQVSTTFFYLQPTFKIYIYTIGPYIPVHFDKIYIRHIISLTFCEHVGEIISKI
jgi:hypothetical protein